LRCAENGIPFAEKTLVVHDLTRADEIFLCGTGAELVPVTEIDGRVVGNGKPGPMFLRMLELFRAKTRVDGTPFK
jgi:branched-chain amino acid aminotransferase